MSARGTRTKRGKIQGNLAHSNGGALEPRERNFPAEIEGSPKEIEIPRTLSVKELAELVGVSAIDVIKQLMKTGIMANVNQAVDYNTAAAVAADFGYQVREEPRAREAIAAELSKTLRFQEDETALLRSRPPVVTIMGHVDHGKTSLLDAIRQTNVIATEAGGITQHIGAYQVEVDGQKITFVDTPGHEAFTAMRARGAQVTDIAVIVIAADDGIMPQTVEAINHARAADVPIIVAINKIDKPDANPERVKQQLTENDLLIEEWGGDIICVPVSAKTKEGIPDLLENILLVAELAELRANPQRDAVGVVLEAELDNTRGPLATVLVQTGNLEIGDDVVVSGTFGRVKAMFNDKGKHVRRAEPSMPVKVLGLNAVPEAGDILKAVPNEKIARALVEEYQRAMWGATRRLSTPVTLDGFYAQIEAGRVKELNVVLKTDVQGTIAPIKGSLERLETERVKVRIIHSASGNITDSDVLLALASKGVVMGFNTDVEPSAQRLAEAEGVDIRIYSVIYELVDDVQKALAGMLEPVYAEVVEGHGEVRAVFTSGKRGKVAGVYITDGRITRGAQVRILRRGQKVHESSVVSLKRFKDDVREVTAGFECGVGIDGFLDFEVGDIIETYRTERKGSSRASS